MSALMVPADQDRHRGTDQDPVPEQRKIEQGTLTRRSTDEGDSRGDPTARQPIVANEDQPH